MDASIWDRLVVRAVPASSRPKACRPKKEARPPRFKADPPPQPKLVQRVGGALNPWGLSHCQLRAADMLAHGSDFATIATTMGISRKTLDSHLSRARERMGVKSSTGMVAAWFRVNLIREAEEHRRLVNERLAAKLEAVCARPV